MSERWAYVRERRPDGAWTRWSYHSTWLVGRMVKYVGGLGGRVQVQARLGGPVVEYAPRKVKAR